MRTIISLGCIAFSALILIAGCGKHKDSEHETHGVHAGEAPDAHAGEAPDAHAGEAPDTHAGEAPDTHAGEAPDAHAGEAPDAHAGESIEIEVTPEAMKMAEITLAKATVGSITGSIDLSGEVGFNEDRLVHITPRFAGIAKSARFTLGELVSSGDIVATIESNENLTHYDLKAPISGRVIQKHISPGEHVSESESIYIIADLSNVWVNLAVYPKDAAQVKTGQKVSISVVGSYNTAQGTINYVTPMIDPQTRTVTARVVLPNSGNQWRPGTFVNAHIETGEAARGIVVDKDAVQILNNETVVFVQHEPNFFKPVDVTVGESDSRSIRILSGLEDGAEYVNKGAFELKAKIVTSSLGGHAGHGH